MVHGEHWLRHRALMQVLVFLFHPEIYGAREQQKKRRRMADWFRLAGAFHGPPLSAESFHELPLPAEVFRHPSPETMFHRLPLPAEVLQSLKRPRLREL